MADPLRNQNDFYAAEYDEIETMFEADEIDWATLTPRIATALADPFLPRWHRANLEALAVCDDDCDFDTAREHIQHAKEAIADMREVLRADPANHSSEYIEARLASVIKLVAIVEADYDLASDDESEEPREGDAGQAKDAPALVSRAPQQPGAPSVKRKPLEK
ncbi:hypothetical protein LTR08_008669 [Meristemomyces frigidus]|nr:hypothetical protein LTR08_008669 [Meristemomyces frigidus]